LRLASRNPQPGPEDGLVEWFLGTTGLLLAPRGFRVTVFREPRLESGFPDLVFVVWSERIAHAWTPRRSDLLRRDIRLLQLILELGSASESDLAGIVGKRAHQSVDRLAAGGLIRRVGGGWSVKALRSIFAVREIIAIEAKMGEWGAVMRQAFLNTWFASMSYVLLPGLPRRRSVLIEAERLGVGVWARSHAAGTVLRPARFDLPRSYASWLFNEWAWRAAVAEA
jgi:hypothetical protein